MTHSEAVAKVIKAIQKRFGSDCLVFKRQVGLLYSASGNPVKVGVPGQADIWGWASAASGFEWEAARPFEVEVKVGKDRPSKAQKNWQATCERFGVVHWVCYADRPGGIDDCIFHLETFT